MLAHIGKLLKKDVKWEWTDQCDKDWQTIRQILAERPLLYHHDHDKPYYISVDASGVSIGACLMQTDGKGHYIPIQYASRALTEAERKRPRYGRTNFSRPFME